MLLMLRTLSPTESLLGCALSIPVSVPGRDNESALFITLGVPDRQWLCRPIDCGRRKDRSSVLHRWRCRSSSSCCCSEGSRLALALAKSRVIMGTSGFLCDESAMIWIRRRGAWNLSQTLWCGKSLQGCRFSCGAGASVDGFTKSVAVTGALWVWVAFVCVPCSGTESSVLGSFRKSSIFCSWIPKPPGNSGS